MVARARLKSKLTPRIKYLNDVCIGDVDAAVTLAAFASASSTLCAECHSCEDERHNQHEHETLIERHDALASGCCKPAWVVINCQRCERAPPG